VGIFPAVHDLVHSTGFVVARNLAIFFAVVLWLGLAFRVNGDARRRIRDPILVFFATLLGLAAPYICPVVYLVFRPAETLDDARSRRVEMRALEQQLARSQQACPVCRASIEPDYIACPVWATMLRQPCLRCAARAALAAVPLLRVRDRAVTGGSRRSADGGGAEDHAG